MSSIVNVSLECTFIDSCTTMIKIGDDATTTVATGILAVGKKGAVNNGRIATDVANCVAVAEGGIIDEHAVSSNRIAFVAIPNPTTNTEHNEPQTAILLE